jgi:Protein of unknown function (DUF2934)
VDTEARRKKQRELIAELLERKIQLHARELYEKRGKAEGQALNDWVEAESQVLANGAMAALYRKVKTQGGTGADLSAEPAGCESGQ